jgi:hypothetical protein
MPQTTLRLLTRSSILAIALAAAPPVLADHGPGTSGGGSATQSAETLKPGKFSFELREDFTEFEHLSAAEIDAKALNAGAIDVLDRSFIETVSIAYGIAENFQAGLAIGHYHAVGAGEREYDANTATYSSATSNPDGLTDLWLSAKYRFYRGPLGQMAVFAGVKFPAGRSDVNDSNGAPLEPSATAGSGSVDGMAGLAYSRFLTSRVTLDASAQYTFRAEHHQFRLGDRFDGGVAFAYRFTRDIRKFPQFSAFAEANVRHLAKSRDTGVLDDNTGGTALFITPGFRVGFCEHFSITVGVPVPVVQDLNGEQLKTSFKVNASLNLSF